MPTDVSALQLVLTADPALIAIVRLSLLVSLAAVFFGAPLSACRSEQPSGSRVLPGAMP